MGLRRYERVQSSSRPAAKLGGGGGWNIEEHDAAQTSGAHGGIAHASPAPLPPYPGSGPAAVWGQQGVAAAATAAAVASSAAATGPKLKAFSGRGWRKAAPGFGNPEDRIDAPPLEPKILIGNLATDVPPEVMRGVLETCVDGLDLDVPGELVAIHMANFGPARRGAARRFWTRGVSGTAQ